jgi:hypothetical protein
VAADGDESFGDDSVSFVRVPPSVRVVSRTMAMRLLDRNSVVLAPFNATVREYNAAMLKLYETHATPIINSQATYVTKGTINKPLDFLEREVQEGCPLHDLKLCVGAPVVVLRNLNVANGLCNGTILTVTDIQERIILGIDQNKDEHIIPRIKFQIKSVSDCVVYRVQFPLALATSLTISKAQGKTLPQKAADGRPPHSVFIDLTRPVKLHGSLYVCTSRVRCCSDLTIVLSDEQYAKFIAAGGGFELRNIVYPEVLERGFLFNNRTGAAPPVASAPRAVIANVDAVEDEILDDGDDEEVEEEEEVPQDANLTVWH